MGIQTVIVEGSVGDMTKADLKPYSEPTSAPVTLRSIERRERALWISVSLVTLALTLCIASFTMTGSVFAGDRMRWMELHDWVRGLAALVLLFNIYGVYQQIQIHRMRRQLNEQTHLLAQVEHNAAHDSLTGLPNKSLFARKLQRAWARARRYPEYTFAVLFIDIDAFRVVNESLGHSYGDQLLFQISQRLAGCMRVDVPGRLKDSPPMSAGEDVLARVAGDEFAVFLDDIHDPSDTLRVCERIQKVFAAPFTVAEQDIVISASIGVALGSGAPAQSTDLLLDAEIAMRRAQASGPGGCEVFDRAMHANAVRRLQLEIELRRGLEKNEFKCVFQPILCLRDGRIVGFEALARWLKPEGVVMPAEFIDVANETGLILTMNRALMREACLKLGEWQSSWSSPTPLTMSLNLASQQLSQHDLADEIAGLARDTGVNPSCLELEIVETIAMGFSQNDDGVLARLKATGARLAIDDFGTGYSSLSRLQRLPVDTLKIDRSFTAAIDSATSSQEIVRAIVMLAHSTGLKVVAEGVETESQANYLKAIGCDMAQGYLFSRPVDAVQIEKLLLAGTIWPQAGEQQSITAQQGSA